MPTLRNNGTKDIIINNEIIKPNETKIMEGYSYDPDIEIVSHDPIWQLGLTGDVITDAITGSKTYDVPEGTINIEIFNLSSNIIKMYNVEEKVDNKFVIFVPGLQRIIEKVKSRVKQFELVGTAAENEVIVSFYG